MLISTINTNFVANSWKHKGFRQSLLQSDLCTVDGIGMLLLCHLSSVSKMPRVSGADLLERLLSRERSALGRPLRVFFFGGNEAVADLARRVVNKLPSSAVCCVGSVNPGFGTMDELSRPELLAMINDAQPDFLIAALGAERGQEWLMRNRAHLDVPVCAHLGAAVNFVAGSIVRAPRKWQRLGLEWAWRIRQEPALARRYFKDGLFLARLLMLDALPLILQQWRDQIRFVLWPKALEVAAVRGADRTTIVLKGAAFGCVDLLDAAFADALEAGQDVTLDCRGLEAMDAAGVGIILRLERDLTERDLRLTVQRVPKSIGHRLNPMQVAA